MKLRDIPLSVLDLATVHVGDNSPREAFMRTVELAKHTESLGYKRYWLAEHHNTDGIASSAPAVLIDHVATQTKRIRVGSGGVMLPNHAPLAIAEQFGTLALLHPDRIDLGLGRAPGTDPSTARALRRHIHQTANDFPDLLAELQRYLTGDPALRVNAFPGTSIKVPIWILGSSTDSAKLAAAEGLPYSFASHFAPEELFEAIKIYRQRFQPSQWLQKPYVMVALSVLVADTDEQARFLLSSSILRFLALTRGHSTKLMPPVESLDGLCNEAESSIIASRFSLACIGAPDTVRTKMESIVEMTKPDELMIASDCFDHAARLRSYELLAEIHRSADRLSAQTR